MASSGSTRESLAWAATLAMGAWLSVRVAHWIVYGVDQLGGARGRSGADEPVREIVEEVLSEHQADDNPMVHAFEDALEVEEAGAPR